MRCLFYGDDYVKRNLETIRHIMTRLDSYDNTEVTGDIAYHLQELINQDLVKASQTLADGRIIYYQGLALTWNGHELLAAISNKTVWDLIKEKLYDHNLTVDDVPVEVVKKISEKVIIDMLGV